MIKNLCIDYRGMGLIPGHRTKILQAVLCSPPHKIEKNYAVTNSYEVRYTQLMMALFFKLCTTIKSLRFVHFYWEFIIIWKKLMKFKTVNNYFEKKLFCNYFENRNQASV